MKKKCPTILVAIVGGSGSGKTHLAEKLCAALPGDALRISLDDFYRDRSRLAPGRREKLNFDHPRAIDWESLLKVLEQLTAGRAAVSPCYDFATHCRAGQPRMIPAKPIIIVDGLWLLRRSSLRRLFELKIFIDCPTQTRWRRRLARDVASRGRTRESIREQFWNTVEPMHERFVAPQRRWADLVLKHDFSEQDARQLAEQLRARLKVLRCNPKEMENETASERRYAARFERGGIERDERQRLSR